MVAGFFIVFIAAPVGASIISLFGIWWALMRITLKHRQELIHASMRRDHRFECDRVDEQYERQCKPIEDVNQRRMAAWHAAKEALDQEHIRLRREADEEDRRQIAAWETEKAVRMAQYERSCNEVDMANRRLIAAWEAANAPWLEEDKRWRDRSAKVETELKRLESELLARRATGVGRFGALKNEAEEIVATCNRAMQEYENELRQAEVNSRTIQLEEHLDKALIRQAKLKGITNERRPRPRIIRD